METSLDFSDALHYIKAGKRVARKGWNGKGMWIVLVEPIAPEHTAQLGSVNRSGYSAFINGCPEPIPTHSFIAMKTADNWLVPWLCSQTDMLASDWEVVA